MTTGNEIEIGFVHAETGEILMLNKKERILVKELLAETLSSEGAKEVIKKIRG